MNDDKPSRKGDEQETAGIDGVAAEITAASPGLEFSDAQYICAAAARSTGGWGLRSSSPRGWRAPNDCVPLDRTALAHREWNPTLVESRLHHGNGPQGVWCRFGSYRYSGFSSHWILLRHEIQFVAKFHEVAAFLTGTPHPLRFDNRDAKTLDLSFNSLFFYSMSILRKQASIFAMSDP